MFKRFSYLFIADFTIKIVIYYVFRMPYVCLHN